MPDRTLSCYISAPAGVNLDVLIAALEKRGVEIVAPSVVPAYVDWQRDIGATIQRVDLVIGVLTRQRRSDFTLFEMGQAWAARRRILLIVPPENSFVPYDLENMLVVRASVRNVEAIDFAVGQVVRAPPRIDQDHRIEVQTLRNLGDSSGDFIAQAAAAAESGDSRGLEKVVASALRQSGVEVVAEELGFDRGFDLALWSNALGSAAANPLLVEIKSKIGEPERLRQSLQRLSQSVSSAGTTWALFLYGDGPDNEERLFKSAPPNVLTISIRTLFQQMSGRTFAEVIRDLRNQRMHGAPHARY